MGFRIQPQICYDLRFPVSSTNYAGVLINVANWPLCRQSQFEILLKARAVENQAVVLACNRVGYD